MKTQIVAALSLALSTLAWANGAAAPHDRVEPSPLQDKIGAYELIQNPGEDPAGICPGSTVFAYDHSARFATISPITTSPNVGTGERRIDFADRPDCSKNENCWGRRSLYWFAQASSHSLRYRQSDTLFSRHDFLRTGISDAQTSSDLKISWEQSNSGDLLMTVRQEIDSNWKEKSNLSVEQEKLFYFIETEIHGVASPISSYNYLNNPDMYPDQNTLRFKSFSCQYKKKAD